MQGAWGDVRGAEYPVFFVVVGAEVFQRGDGAAVYRVVASHALGIGGGHLADEERVFAVALFGASPAWVTLRVNCGTPEHQMSLGVFPVIKASLFAGDLAQLFHQIRVKGGRQTDGLGEYGGRLFGVTGDIATGDLLSHIPFSDAQAFYRELVGGEQTDFFFDGQTREQVPDTFFQGQFGVAKILHNVPPKKASLLCIHKESLLSCVGMIIALPPGCCQ